jgi:aromatic-L-amino-acid/L-tryptophan decarboxylase
VGGDPFVTTHPLEPTGEELRALVGEALAYLAPFVDGLPDAPAGGLPDREELAERLLEKEPPERGVPLAEALDVLRDAVPRAFDTTGPGYLAYIPGGGLVTAALADLLADVTNRYVGMWQPAPALAQLEWNVIRWLCDAFGYPEDARGILTTGGSMANLSALVAARTALLGDDLSGGTVYLTAETHASVAKAAVIAGIPRRNLRSVPTTPELRMDPDALRERIRTDRRDGLRPFCVVVSAGTVNTGAVDPIGEVVDRCAEEGLWSHVDGAYGGFFRLTERGRERFRGIERADSVTLDPHKGMFLPYGTGCLLVREGRRLLEAHAAGPARYLQDLVREGESLNFSDYSPELSRDFRGLRVWLPLKLHGLAAFREALEEKLDLARLLYEGIRDAPGVEVPWEPDLSIVAWRAAGEDPDAAGRAMLQRINASGRVFLSSTVIEDRFTLRAAILSHRTHRDRIEEAIDIIRAAAIP